MDKILVGSDECSVDDIVNLLEKSPVFHVLDSQMRTLGRSLEISPFDCDRINTEYRLAMNSLAGSLKETLLMWVAEKPEEATLQKLILIMEQDKFMEFSRILRNQFHLPKSGDAADVHTSNGKSRNPSDSDEYIEVAVDRGKIDQLRKLSPRVEHFFAESKNYIVNTSVILEISSMLVFDSLETDPLLKGLFPTERTRMQHFWQLIMSRDEETIMRCITKLANLDGAPAWANRFRSLLREYGMEVPRKE